jgi:hypothetical protein
VKERKENKDERKGGIILSRVCVTIDGVWIDE